MGGEATFLGTTYQAELIAYVAVHIVAGTPLGWFGGVDDTPTAVSGETEGPGDDAQVEFGGRVPPIEIQAKHGLTGGAKLDKVVMGIRARAPAGSSPRVVLAVDRSSSKTVHQEFARDLDRVRSGRRDRLKAVTKSILRSLGGDPSVLAGLCVVLVDAHLPSDPDLKQALTRLELLVEDADQARCAWSALVKDAGDVCARRLRRNRQDLVECLAAAGLKIKPPSREQVWHLKLDMTRELLRQHEATGALALLRGFELELEDADVEPSVRYRLAQHRAAAFLELQRYDDALKSALRALDHDPGGVHALAVGGFAAMLADDTTTAIDLADRATAAAPDDPTAWAARAQVYDKADKVLPGPPPVVEESDGFRAALAQIAANHTEWGRVDQLTGALLARNYRDPKVLVLRVQAMLALATDARSAVDRARIRDAERLAEEVISASGEAGHPSRHRGFILRAEARRRLGRSSEAERDLESARRIAPNEPDAIYNLAAWRYEAGEHQAALEVLQHPAVAGSGRLLVLRATVKERLGDKAGARADVENGLSQTGNERTRDEVRHRGAEVLLEIGETELASRALGAVSEGGRALPEHALIRGRLALSQGAIDEGAALYRDAAGRDDARRCGILAELGSQLLRLGRAVEAVAAFDEIGGAGPPEAAVPVLARALVGAGDLVRAQAVIEGVAQTGPLPEWALATATDIALRREDVQGAIDHLAQLVERGKPTPQARLELARLLIERGRVDGAQPYLDALVDDAQLGPANRMNLARLLHQAGRVEEALALGYRAFRDAPNDPRLNRALIVLALKTRVAPQAPNEVGPDTHVWLKDQDGRELEYTIQAQPPISAFRHELSLAGAQGMGLIGKRTGDEVVRNPGELHEQRFTVTKISSALQHAVQDAIDSFEARFPGEPLFVAGFSIGHGKSVRELAPFVASLGERERLAKAVLAQYQSLGVPLSFVAQALGVTIPELIDGLANDPQIGGPVIVEAPEPAAQAQSCAAAMAADEVVLTRSALHTAQQLGLLEHLAATYTLVSPVSLEYELRAELDRAESEATDGRRSLSGGPAGFSVQELEPGHPALQTRLQTTRSVVTWFNAAARIELRPLEAVRPLGSHDEEVRETIGHSAFDSLKLAQHRAAALFADDLWLRQLPLGETSCPSFSSIGLVEALRQRSLLTQQEANQHLIAMIQRNYAHVKPSEQLLSFAVRSQPERGQSPLAKVFALLGGPEVTPADAARIAAGVIRTAATEPIQLCSVEALAQIALESMSSKWPRLLCAQLLQDACRGTLALLHPRYLRAVHQTCKAFAKGGPMPLSGAPGI